MITKDKLDIETLEYVKFHFELYSDATPKTHGYKWLCKIINELKDNASKSNKIFTNENNGKTLSKPNLDLQKMLDICPECKNIMRHSSINNVQCYNCGYRTSNI